MMQVLVALARANGAVLSRDELIRQCWGGRIVGDDAINRCVSKVRQLADLGGKAFEIETIPRVGYRLRRTGTCATLPETRQNVRQEQVATIAEAATPASQARVTNRRRLILIALAGILVIPGIVAAISYFLPLRPKEWTIVESHMPFIATPLVERAPDFSPNGWMIAYSAGPDYLHRSIYVRLISGGEPLRLVGPPLSSYSPVWSPDGSQIAFHIFTPREPCKIMLVAALGGQPREIGRCRTATFSTLAWDRPGGGMLFTDSPNNHTPVAIYRLDLSGGPLRQLTHPQGGPAGRDGSGTISPDGKTLAFLRQIGAARNQIILQDLATGAERVLLSTKDDDDPLAWSNDSSALFVGRNIPWDSSLWAYPVDGSAAQRITNLAENIGWVSSGPNGLVAMDLERSEYDIAIASPLPGQPGKSLDADGWSPYSLAYSRDGVLAATARRSGVTSLLLSGSDGALHELLQLKNDTAGFVTWSPDGSRLAFAEPANASFTIMVVNRRGEIVKRVPYRAQEMGGLAWSEDGQNLLVTSEDARGWRTWQVALARNGTPQAVMPYGWRSVVARGRMMFGVKSGTKGIWRLDGTPRKITSEPDDNSGFWEISGDRIIYGDFSNPDVPVAMAVPVTGGTPKPIGYLAGPILGSKIAFNPKTGLVAYLRVTRQDTDIGWLRVARK
ncbi:MAG: PD40 domain-containing protein [Alphaproteobacteria bacterium]|nr:PD40 domain-containing protein [Alphaproteobacteria bacterium]